MIRGLDGLPYKARVEADRGYAPVQKILNGTEKVNINANPLIRTRNYSEIVSRK